MPLSLLLPLLLAPTDAAGIASPYASPLPREIVEKKADEDRRRREQAAQTVDLPQSRSRAGCIGAVEADPARSAQLARDALGEAIGRERVRAGLCLGVALAELDRWDEAQRAFTDARDAAEPGDDASRARLGAMAGNAALAAGRPGEALALLAPAAVSAQSAGNRALTASISLDRARALVALKQPDAAFAALAQAREAAPDDAQAWLLSATLSRRQDKLIEAQAQIEKAAQLAQQDPEVGLEAGVIAVLSGRPEAARKSWEAVVSLAPGSDAAATAKGYIAQLGS